MTTHRRSATARSLTREEVTRVARETIEADGFAALTMRRLATRCGVGTMTLYSYFRTKEELLGALAGTYLDEMTLPSRDDCSWDERVRVVFRELRRVLLRYPHLAVIAGTQPLVGISAFRGAELVLASLAEAEIEGVRAAAVFDVLLLFTIGFAQREVTESASEPALAVRLSEVLALPREEFPHLRASALEVAERAQGRHFDEGLDAILSPYA